MENEVDPVAMAERFAAEAARAGFELDFSLESLETEVDRLLEGPSFCRGREREPTEDETRSVAALAAYVGETLRRLFGGEWSGSFYPGDTSFYTSSIRFGDYRYWPTHFIGYRLRNWPQEGTFAEHLRRLLPNLRPPA